jgi:hypothetical protein
MPLVLPGPQSPCLPGCIPLRAIEENWDGERGSRGNGDNERGVQEGGVGGGGGSIHGGLDV